MTASILPEARTARRASKALGIVTRQECEPLDVGGWRVRDTGTGSGTWHQTTTSTCSCADFTFRRLPCKHIEAVIREQRDLAAYCDSWNARSEQARLTAEDLDWLSDDVNRDDYSGPYGSDGWPLPRPCCPECGAELECRSYWVGGRGMLAFLCCTLHNEHQALPA
jgi:hypothetical protein